MESSYQQDNSQQRVNVSGNTINLMNGTLQIQTVVAPWARSSANDGVRWQHWHGSKAIPLDAVLAGHDTGGDPIYVGQAFHEGNLIPAKVIPNAGCALYAYDSEEIQKRSCQVLCGGNVTWVHARDRSIPPKAIPGGRTASGEVIYIGRTHYCGSLTPGKVVPSKRKLYIPYGCCEVVTKRFEILVLN